MLLHWVTLASASATRHNKHNKIILLKKISGHVRCSARNMVRRSHSPLWCLQLVLCLDNRCELVFFNSDIDVYIVFHNIQRGFEI